MVYEAQARLFDFVIFSELFRATTLRESLIAYSRSQGYDIFEQESPASFNEARTLTGDVLSVLSHLPFRISVSETHFERKAT